ncbi:MAG: S24/S26 family peptidase [Clostridia bacterium]|nr:S24/S26 family peptidase [Clostridia bacterium]
MQYSNIEERLASDGFFVSTTAGVSMKPMLRDRRDRVVLVPVGAEKLKKWDLPAYRRADGKCVLHRIIAVKEDYYIIRGDNTYAKEYVPHEQIFGYVTEFYRGKKHIRTDSKWYRLYASVWNKLYFLRLPLRWLRVLASKLKHLFMVKFGNKG